MILGHGFAYVVARFIPGVLGVVTTAALTRLLGPVQYGVYGLVLTVMTIVSSVAFDWLSVSFLRLYPTRRFDFRTISTFIHIFFISMLISAGLTIIGFGLTGITEGNAEIYALGLALAWASSWFSLVSSFEIANFRPLRYLGMNLARSALMFAGATGAAWISNDPILTAAGMGVGLLVSSAFGTFERPQLRIRYFDHDLAKEILTFGVPMAASLSLTGILSGGTRALVAEFGSSEALGLYTAAFLVVQNGLLVIASGISSVTYQLAVEAVNRGDPIIERQQLLENGTLLLFVLAPICLGTALTADGIAQVLVGPEFQAGVAALIPWMAVGAFLASFRAFYLEYAFNLGSRPSLQIWAPAVATIVAISLSLYLIPRKGALGAAVAVTVAMAISCVLAAAIGRRARVIPLPFAAAGRVVCCCLFMTALVLAVPERGPFRFVTQIAAGGFGYLCAAFALNLLEIRTRVISYLSGRRAA